MFVFITFLSVFLVDSMLVASPITGATALQNELQLKIEALRQRAQLAALAAARQTLRNDFKDERERHLFTPDRRTMWEDIARCTTFLQDAFDNDPRLSEPLRLVSDADDIRERALQEMIAAPQTPNAKQELALNVLLRHGLNNESTKLFLSQQPTWPESIWQTVLALQNHASLQRRLLAYRLLSTRTSVPPASVGIAQKQTREMPMRKPPHMSKILGELQTIQLLRSRSANSFTPALSSEDRWLLRHLDEREVFLRALLLSNTL
jgi:hypothetical protein